MNTQVAVVVEHASINEVIHLEAIFAHIMRLHDGDVYPIERRAAEEMLALFRKVMSRHNTKRHVLAIADRDGVGVVLVNGSSRWLWRHSFRHRTDAINTLLRIQALLQPKFVQYVRNERIN